MEEKIEYENYILEDLKNSLDDLDQESLRQISLKLINNISVSKRMLVNKKFNFYNLPKELRSLSGCKAYILGLEWALSTCISTIKYFKKK